MNGHVDDITSRRTGGCLYCGSQGPCTDEHVVSAGMGGDDPLWLLTECVCNRCNTVIFSPLENELLRRSPTALGRFFNQEGTRDRNRPPTFESRTMLVHDPQSDLLFTANPSGPGEFRILPQIVCFTDLEGTKVAGTAAAHDEFEKFLKVVGLIVGNEICLIDKQGKTSFEVSPLQWENDRYVPGLPEMVSKPPSRGIWLEPLDRPATANHGEVLPRCLYQRQQGQLVCRASSVVEACKVLLLVRQHLQDVQGTMMMPISEVRDPGVHFGMATDMNKADRALVKVGLNILAFCVSKEVMRNEAFDEAVKFVRDGSTPCLGTTLADGNIVGPALPSRNTLVLQQNAEGSVCFFARLYDGSAQVFELGQFDFYPAALSEPLILHVDYNAHQIRRCSLEEHVVSIVAEFAEPLANDEAF